jgi:hypothetical protein
MYAKTLIKMVGCAKSWQKIRKKCMVLHKFAEIAENLHKLEKLY